MVKLAVVKVLIILATALLVPVMMKFQAQSIRARSNAHTAGEVLGVLEEMEVGSPEVTVRYFEASIGGAVASETASQAITEKVKEVHGVVQVKNQLVVQGWFQLERKGGRIIGTGAVSEDWKKEIVKGQTEIDVSGLRTRAYLELAGRNPVVWSLFVDQFFQLEGEVSLVLNGGQLRVEGEAVFSDLQLVRKASRNLGNDVLFESGMTLRASPFHFEGRELVSKIEGEPLRRLARQLEGTGISFEEGSVGLSERGKEVCRELAAVLLEAPSSVKFLIGGHPDEGGEGLAEQRARKARAFLLEIGVEKRNLRWVPFEKIGSESGISGQVEILIH